MGKVKGCTYKEGQLLFSLANLLGVDVDENSEVELQKDEDPVYESQNIYMLKIKEKCILKCRFRSSSCVLGCYGVDNKKFCIDHIDGIYYAMYKDGSGINFWCSKGIDSNIRDAIVNGLYWIGFNTIVAREVEKDKRQK